MSKTRRASYLAILGSGTDKTYQRKIYDALEDSDPRGLTIDEIIVMFGGDRKATTVQPRVTELHQLGLIYKTKRTRLSRARREVAVYRIRQHPKPPMERHRCPLCSSMISRKKAREISR